MRRHPHVVDAAVAAVLFAIVVVPGVRQGRLSAVAILAAAVSFGVLPARRRRPVPVFVAATAGAETFLALAHSGTAVLAAPVIALYTVAEATSRGRSLVAGGLAVLVMTWLHAAIGPTSTGAENVALVALGGLAVAAGDAARVRRAYIAEVEERARQAERSRRQEAERRVTEERLRLARDLHDVLGHQIALINVQAGVAADVLDDHPDQARQALTHIKRAGRAALAELRDTVGLLRRPGDPIAPTEPTKGLADLGELLASFGGSGLRVSHVIAGDVRPLPPAADITAYRVIQESLTNVSKHARGHSATVRVDYRPAALHIVVEDDGTGAPAKAAVPGNGIAGMRERVTALGGTLRAGPRAGTGFRVSVRLPFAAAGPP